MHKRRSLFLHAKHAPFNLVNKHQTLKVGRELHLVARTNNFWIVLMASDSTTMTKRTQRRCLILSHSLGGSIMISKLFPSTEGTVSSIAGVTSCGHKNPS